MIVNVDSIAAILCIYCREYFNKVFKDMAAKVENFAGSTESLSYKFKTLIADPDILDRLLKEEGKDILIIDSMDMYLVTRKGR